MNITQIYMVRRIVPDSVPCMVVSHSSSRPHRVSWRWFLSLS
jgi:hypothetical protein